MVREPSDRLRADHSGPSPPLGTLQLARALTDRNLSDQFVARGVETVLKLLDDGA